MEHTLAIVGPGKVGTALAWLLVRAGWELVGVAGRTLESAEAACQYCGMGESTADAPGVTRRAELVLITTPDDAIQPVCEELAAAGGFAENAVVAHCCGALPSTILSAARVAGAHLGSIHPLQSFATVEGAVELLPGSHCCIEGDPEAVTALEAVAGTLNCPVLRISPEAKALYHAAGCVASNYLVALQDAALSLYEAAGIGREEALRAVLPCLKGTLDNLEKVGIPGCLTGPIARGDVDTVRRHLEAIEAAAPELLPLYKLLGRQTVEVSLARGAIAPENASCLLSVLAEYGGE